MGLFDVIQTFGLALLVACCFLPTLCIDEKPTENVEISNSGTGEPAVVSKQENEQTDKDKTSVLVDSFKNTVENNTIEKEQQDLGKTKEVKDQAEKDKGEAEGENDKVKEEGEKNEEKKEEVKEEEGIDLKVLKDSDFEHLTQAATGATTGDWLVLFTKKDGCDDCTSAEKEMKIVYERVKHKLNVAKVVNGRSTKMTFKRFGIDGDLPKIFLFHHGKKFAYEKEKKVDEFIKFLDKDFELAPWTPVREPYTTFEFYFDESMEELKEMLRYKKNVSLIIFLAGFVAGISITSLCGSVIFHLLENFKDEDEVYSEHEQQASRDMAASKNKAD